MTNPNIDPAIRKAITDLIATIDTRSNKGIPVRPKDIVELAVAATLVGDEDFEEAIYKECKKWKVGQSGLADALGKAAERQTSMAASKALLGGTPSGTEQFLDMLGKKFSNSVAANGVIRWAGDVVTMLGFRNRVYLRAEEIDLEYQKHVLDAAIECWIESDQERSTDVLRQQIRYDDTVATLVIDWLEDLCAKMFVAYEDEARPGQYAACMIRNHVWQVKRKLFGLPVDYHKMLIIRGETGGGKSELVRRMTNPLAELRQNKKFSHLVDSRDISARKAYIVFIDEMSGMQKADADALKSFITKDEESLRMMYTNSATVVPVNCTLIGTSNSSMEGLMNDPTGTRRFVDIECISAAAMQARWIEINQGYWLELWQSVNEHGSDPALEVKAIMEKRQEVVRPKTRVEEWLFEFDLKKIRANLHYGEEVKCDEGKLFEKFGEYEDLAFPKMWKMTKRHFNQELRNGYARFTTSSGCSFAIRRVQTHHEYFYYFKWLPRHISPVAVGSSPASPLAQ
jgi:hypothetical protein